MRVHETDFNRHPFRRQSLRPTITIKDGKKVYIDCVETTPQEISNTSNKYGISPRVLSHKIGDEVIRILEGTHISKQLDSSDTFIETINLTVEGQSLVLDIHLRLVIEELSCFLKVVVSN